MSKSQYIKVEIPKWNWWQITLMICLIIIISKVDPDNTLELLKEILNRWIGK